jgi:hypothetical protein
MKPKGGTVMTTDLHHQPADPDLHRKLETWVTAALITPQEAEAIERFEERETAAEIAPHRIPLVTEALGYLGAVLALAAGIALMADRWQDLGSGVRLAAIGVAAAVALGSGWLLRNNTEPAIRRLGSVLWAGSVGLVAWFAAVLATDVLETSDRTTAIIASVTAAIVAGGLFAFRRRPLQQIALFVALFYVVGFVFEDPVPIGTAMLVIGLAWFALGWRGVLEPGFTALVLGSLGALIGPMTITADATGAGVLIGLGVAAGVVTAGVFLRETVLLAIGVLGLFWFLIRGITYFFGGTVGVPIALLAAGAVVLAVALVLARRSGTTRTGPRSPS